MELITLTESKVTLKGDVVEVEPLEKPDKFTTSKDTIASMNFLLFTPDLFEILESRMKTFLDANKDNLESCEFLIPIVLNELVEEKSKAVDVLETTANWYGVTYKEDKDMVVNAIANLVDNGVYPNNLWK